MRACARQHIPKADHDVVLRYLEMLPPECAIYLEDRLRVPADGWTFTSVQEATLEYFQTRAAYSDNHTGGLRQRANWSNDRKQIEGFGAGKPAPTGQSCHRCKGQGHNANQCPNLRAEQDQAWKGRPEEARKRPCHKCGGVGHWGNHCTDSAKAAQQRATQQTNTAAPTSSQSKITCAFWTHGKCTRGDACKNLHPASEKDSRVIRKDCLSWIKGERCKSTPCRFLHEPGKRGSKKGDGKGGAKAGSSNKPVCRDFKTGKCSRQNCRFAHTTRATELEHQEEVTPPAATAPPSSSDSKNEGAASGAVTQNRAVVEDDIKVVWTRPTRTEETQVAQRRQAPDDEPYDFERLRPRLPQIKRPPGGYCWQSTMHPNNLPGTKICVVWDGGAEFPSLSDKACARIMRAQRQLSDAECPRLNPCEMKPPQRFGGFTGDGPRKEVWMLVELTLMTPDGVPLPMVKCSVVPGQIDDLLMAGPVLDQ